MFAEIALPRTTLDTLTYAIPDELKSLAKPGSLVKIKLKNKTTFGIIIEISSVSDTKNTKDILEVLDSQFISPDLLSLIKWAKKYYFASFGQTLNLTLPQSIYQYHPKPGEKSSIDFSPLEINTQLPLSNINEHLQTHQYQTFLLYNPFNKDVTSYYLTLIEQTLKLHKSVIMLVPEIILTPKFIADFKKYCPSELYCLHSGLKPSMRKQIWSEIKTKDYTVVLGTRSAIFAPVQNLGLIIVTQEQDMSYKEIERHFHYHARDIAVTRAQLCNAVALLSSPTPSIESYYNAQISKYKLITIPGESAMSGQRKAVRLIDMRRSKTRILSAPLKYEIQSAYHKAKPIVLYLNRLGFSRILTCQDCGYIPLCPACGIPLILHREEKSLSCNLCKYRVSAFDYCPQCKGNDFLFQGIGTQQVAAEVKKLLPQAEIHRLDSDVYRSKEKEEKPMSIRINPWLQKKILITTQLGIRKLDFTQIKLFGVISADTGLFIPDFRAGEKTFQELAQIINQCKTNQDCPVIIQTYHPDNYAIYLAIQQNYDKFYIQELNQRKKLSYPPFSRLASINVSSAKSDSARQIAEKISTKLNSLKNITVLGPSLASHPKKTKMYTYQVLAKLKPNQSLSKLIPRQELIFDKTDIDINIDPV